MTIEEPAWLLLTLLELLYGHIDTHGTRLDMTKRKIAVVLLCALLFVVSAALVIL